MLECREQGISTGIFSLTLYLGKNSGFKSGPGQFVSLEPLDKATPMSRPFSIVSSEGNRVTVVFRVVGTNTREYSMLKQRDKLKVYGPNGIVVPMKTKSNTAILVAGGVGSPALVELAKQLKKSGKHVIVFLGAKERRQIICLELFKRMGVIIEVVVEKGNHGKIGMVTDFFEKMLKSIDGKADVFACGPKLMLKKVANICASFNTNCTLLVEELMACGMGACKGCTIFGRDGSRKQVCSDGPAFDAEWIDLEKFAPEPRAQVQIDTNPKEVDMSTTFCGICFKTPFLPASGCISAEAISEERVDVSKLAAVVTKGVSAEDRPGNAMPRTCETDSGMINAIGVQNVGVKKFKEVELPVYNESGLPVIVNVFGQSIEEFVYIVKALNSSDIVAYEINISCPNIKRGGMAFGVDPIQAAKVTEAVKKVTDKVVIVKLTPNVTDIVAIARAVVDAGADAISLINTLSAMAFDPGPESQKSETILEDCRDHP